MSGENGTKAHKVILVFVDHDGLGPEEAKSVLEHARYPNRCMSPTVLDIQTVDIGEWSDDHPLNKTATYQAEWRKIFPATPPGTEIVPDGTMEALRRATISLGELAGITTLSTYDYAALDACRKVIKSADAHRDRTEKTTKEEAV